MAMDHLPRPANPTIDLGGIPASQDTFRTIRQFSVIDKVERQERYISMTLNLGIDHVVPCIHERRLHFLHRRQPHLHRVKPIDAPFRKRIEIRYLWGLEVEVALRVQLNPAVKPRTFQATSSSSKRFTEPPPSGAGIAQDAMSPHERTV